MTAFYCILIAVLGYLLGSFNGAIIVSKIMLKEDVRTKGSGNAGLTNFLRSYGGIKTFLVIGIDIFKSVIATAAAWFLLKPYGLGNEAKMIAGTFVMVGHVFPLYFGFKGGKGILTSAAFIFMLDVRVFALVILTFIILVAITKMVSVGSIVAAGLFPVGCLIVFGWNACITPLSIFMAVLIIYKHRSNIKRVLAGTEPKLSFGGKKESRS